MSRVSHLHSGLAGFVCALLSASTIAQTSVISDQPGLKTEGNIVVIDLPTTLRLAKAQNLDIQIARQKLNEAKANQDSATWQFFPWIAPGESFRRHEDRVQAVEGPILEVTKQS